MFIKSAIAMLITVGFAGGAVYYGTKDISRTSNEVQLRAPEKIVPQTPAKDRANSEPTVPKNPNTIAEPIPASATGLNLAEIMPLIMQQIDKMTDVETKDQAYYDVVDFSIRQKQFNFADAAMQNIDQVVLRDTARSKIAVGLALDGRADDAFEVIDAVETKPLRDTMRLQVIEALIVPEKLPRGLGQQ